MLTHTTPYSDLPLTPYLEALAIKSEAQRKASKAPATLAAYQAGWKAFEAFTRPNGLQALPATPATVCLFLADQELKGLKVATIRARLAAIGAVHKEAGFTNPAPVVTVRDRLAGIARKRGTRQKQAKGLTLEDVELIAATIDQRRLNDVRDIALLWAGFCGGLRRSELSALAIDDLDLEATATEPAALMVRQSKTDQDGQGAMVAMLPQAAKALRLWIDGAGLNSGPVFRSIHKSGAVGDTLSGHSIAAIYKRLATRAGLDAALVSGHSPRVGLAQTLTARGATFAQVAQAGRWKGDAMPARYAERQALGQGAVIQFLS